MPITRPRSSSNADPRHGERGASFIEMMIALSLLLVVAAMYYSLFIGTMNVNAFLESHNDTRTIGQRAVNHIRTKSASLDGFTKKTPSVKAIVRR